MRALVSALCGVLVACAASGIPRATATGPQSREEGAVSRAPKTVSIKDFAFDPSVVTVAVGDTVVWVNRDFVPHTSAADSTAWTSPELRTDSRFAFVAGQPGRYPYHCAAHPVMRATLVVTQ
jgi:plastocyanin